MELKFERNLAEGLLSFTFCAFDAKKGMVIIMTAGDIYDYLNEIAPFEYQEEWDNAGFLVGDRSASVCKALLALDPTNEIIKQAKNMGAQLIITHHPFIFRPLKTFTTGNTAYEAARNGISVISVHTNYDAAIGGVNDVLADILELENKTDLFAGEETQAVMRSGTIAPRTAKEFAASVKEKLGASVRYNLPEKQITTVAVCGGSGKEFLNKIIELGFDAFVTGDAGHHEFLEAEENGLALFAAGHFETENPAVKVLRDALENEFREIVFIMAKQISPICHL